MFVSFRVTIEEHLGATGAASLEHGCASVLGCSAKAGKRPKTVISAGREWLPRTILPIVAGVGLWHVLATKTPSSPERRQLRSFRRRVNVTASKYGHNMRHQSNKIFLWNSRARNVSHYQYHRSDRGEGIDAERPGEQLYTVAAFLDLRVYGHRRL